MVCEGSRQKTNEGQKKTLQQPSILLTQQNFITALVHGAK